MLSVDAPQKKLYLTKKKTLVESTLPLFLSYADAKVGCISHGVILCVKKFGCIVRFYEDVKGLVPMAELSNEYVTNPEELFFAGQVREELYLNCQMLLVQNCYATVKKFGVSTIKKKNLYFKIDE